MLDIIYKDIEDNEKCNLVKNLNKIIDNLSAFTTKAKT